MPRRLIALTAGHSNPHTAKTAACVLRYRPEEVVAVLDPEQAGRRVQDLLGAGGDTPIVASLAEAPTANTLLLGIAPPGGKIPASWRPVIREAIARGMDILSGLHDFVSADPEFAAAAAAAGVRLIDVRKNNERDVARRVGLRQDRLRVHTVGHDCSVGKMVAAVEITNGLKARGRDAKFLATGQTGIIVEGDGLPLDCIVADFVSGAAEKLVLANQHHEILVIEGQGTLAHPSYSGVTLSLLHGCSPQALIMVYEAGRTAIAGVESVRIPPLADLIRIYETLASLMQPCRVIGVALNGRKLSADEARRERDRARAELGLPVADVLRDGPAELVEAVLRTEEEGWWKEEGEARSAER